MSEAADVRHTRILQAVFALQGGRVDMDEKLAKALAGYLTNQCQQYTAALAHNNKVLTMLTLTAQTVPSLKYEAELAEKILDDAQK